MKRPFSRGSGGELVDRAVSAHGVVEHRIGPTTLHDTSRGDRDVDDLLVALAEGDYHEAPQVLAKDCDDPRVAPALATAMRRAPPGFRHSLVVPLKRAEPTVFREVATKLLPLLLGCQDAWKVGEHINAKAMDLAALAAGLLELCPEDENASNALWRVCCHPNENNRAFAVDVVARAFEGRKSTGAVGSLRARLAGLLGSAEGAMALGIVRALGPDEHAEALSYVGRALASTDDTVQLRGVEAATFVYAAATEDIREELRELLRSWLDPARDPHAIDIALGLLLHGGDTQVAVPYLERGLSHESPVLRLSSARQLGWLPSTTAMALAREALDDEPDPVIRRVLDEVLHDTRDPEPNDSDPKKDRD